MTHSTPTITICLVSYFRILNIFASIFNLIFSTSQIVTHSTPTPIFSCYLGPRKRFALAAFPDLYRARFQTEFRASDFGLCSLRELLSEVDLKRQELFEVLKEKVPEGSEDKIEVAATQSLEDFVRNAIKILEEKEGYTCSVQGKSSVFPARNQED